MQTPKSDAQGSRIRPGVIVTVAGILGVLAAGYFLGWFGGGPSPATNTEGGAQASSESARTEAAQTGQTTASPEQSAAPVARPGTPSLPVASAGPLQPAELLPVASTTPVAGLMKAGEWEQRLDDILGGAEDEPQKATKLLEMFPHLPEDGQVEVAQHLSNLLTDDRYPALGQTLTNAATPEAVLDVLMTDVLNRGNVLKLPTLLDVARTANHPKAEEARDVLEVFVDENYGTDWTKWETAIQKWLKENPDEPAEAETK